MALHLPIAETRDTQPNALEVDLDAIAHNVRRLRGRCGADVTFVAALKGNAYGFGLDEVAPAVLAAGADVIAVVRLDHAVRLREAGVAAPILLYAGVPPTRAAVSAIAANDLMVTIVDGDHLRAYADGGSRIRALVKVDVGLERLGASPADAVGLARTVDAEPSLELAGVYTHLQVPPGAIPDVKRYVAWEFERFASVLAELDRLGVAVPIRMAISSGALRISDEMRLNAIDVGSLLFGLDTPGPVDRDLGLRPALVKVTTRLTQVRDMERTEFTEFSAIPTGRPVRLGVIPFGAIDGMLGIGVGHVLVGGQRAPTLGVSLEHTRVDLTGIDARTGDEVVIVGRQGDAEISVREVATAKGLHTPAYVPVLVGADVARRYVHLGGAAG